MNAAENQKFWKLNQERKKHESLSGQYVCGIEKRRKEQELNIKALKA